MAASLSTGPYDCLVLFDDHEEHEADTEGKESATSPDKKSSADVARKVKVDLESAGVSVYPDPPPGAKRTQSVTTGINESGVILLLITKTLSQHFTNVVGQAYKQTNKTIVPIFFNASPYEVQMLLKTPALTPVDMHHHEIYDEPGSMKKILSSIKTPQLSDSLKKTYKLKLKDSVSSLADWSFPEPSASNVYIAPRCEATRKVDGQLVEDNPLRNTSNFIDILQNARLGDTVMVHAAAGFGKSSLLCNTVLQWLNGHLSKYKYLYLLTVREIRNHTEVLERVITRDLELLPKDCESAVRMSLKFCAKECLFLVDGYDELSDDVKGYSNLNDLLTRRKYNDSMKHKMTSFIEDFIVVISTRPNCVQHILEKTSGHLIDLPLHPLSDNDVQLYVKENFAENKDMVHKFLLKIPALSDMLKVPLFLMMLCKICKDVLNKHVNLSTLSSMRTASVILNNFCILLLGIKHNKAPGIQQDILWKRERETQNRLDNLTQLCFDTLEKKVYRFDVGRLREYKLCIDDLTALGPINVAGAGDKTEASFIHASFHEYYAGMYIARNESALVKVLKEWRGSPTPSKKFESYRSALIYAVGIENNILSNVTQYLRLSNLSEAMSSNSGLVDLIVESELLHECDDQAIRLKFLDKIKSAPVNEDTLRTSRPEINISAYETLLSDLDHSGCLDLVKRIYTKRDPDNDEVVVLPEIGGDLLRKLGVRYMDISDPLSLSLLSNISLRYIQRLQLNIISPALLKHIEKEKIGPTNVEHLDLKGVVTVNQLVSLIRLISPPGGLKCVEVEADVTATTDVDFANTHLVSVEEFKMLKDSVNQAALKAITARIKINTLSLMNMPVDSDPEGNYTLENVKKLIGPSSVQHLDLKGKLTVNQLMFLISLISPPAGLDCVEVEADLTLTTEDDPTSTHLVSVKTFRMLNDRVTLAVLRAITDRVKINTLSLLNMPVDSDPEGNYALENVPKLIGPSSVQHLNLKGEVTVNQLVTLIKLISPPAGLKCVDLEADVTLPTEVEPANIHLVAVKRLRMVNKVNLPVLKAITERIQLDKLYLVNMPVDSDPEGNYALENVPKLKFKNAQDSDLPTVQKMCHPSLKLRLPTQADGMVTPLQESFSSMNITSD